MTDNPEIRAAGTGDLGALLSLYRQLNPGDPALSPADAERNLDMLSRYPGSAVLVGFADGKAVATCTLVVVPNLTRGGAPYGLIENVVTDAASRRRGFGRAVVDHAVERAFEAGCYKVMLLTGSKDAGTMDFYRAAGFSQDKTGFQIRRIPARAS